jgi:hypothetical protein
MRQDKVESSSHRVNPAKHWSLLKVLLGKNSRPPPNQPISFKKKVFMRASAIASSFGRLFTSVVPHKSDPRARKVRRNLNAHHKIDKDFAPFTNGNTLDAINSAKSSTAVGPDGLTAIYLKYLGLRWLEYLTKLL